MTTPEPIYDRGCTVAELIAHLQTMPPDARVAYDSCSETTPLSIDEVKLRDPKDQYIFYNGIYMKFRPRYWPKGRPVPAPDFVTFVNFPGN